MGKKWRFPSWLFGHCLQSDFLHESTVHCVSCFSDVFPLNSVCLLNCQLVTFHVFLLTLLFSTYRFLCDGHRRNCGVSVRKGPASDPKPIHSLDHLVICVDEVVRLRPRHLICASDKDHIEDKTNDLFFWKYLLLILPEIYRKTVTL